MMAIFALAMANYVRDQWYDEEQFTHRDFHNFHNAGTRIRAGEAVYQHDEIPFLLTPLAAPAVVLLSYVPEHAAFVGMAVFTGLLYVLAVLVVIRTCRGDPRASITAGFLACSMPPFWFALYLGQLTGIWLFLMSAALALLAVPRAEGRSWRTEALSGVLTAVLCVKPQLALVVLLVAGLRRAWPMLAAFVVTFAILWAVSIPFLGVRAFLEWREQVTWCAEALEGADTTWWRQFTLYAFLRSVTSHAAMDMEVARWAYLAIVGPLGIATVLAVREALRPDDRRLALRAVSMLVLASIALNTYLFYYDSAFLVVPWIVSFLAYQTYGGVTRGIVVLLAAVSWVLALTTPILQQGGVPLPGLFATVWLVVEILDLARGKAARAAFQSVAQPV